MFVVLRADINECESNDSNNCDKNAQCTNTDGSFTCTCNSGYSGDGVSCTSKLATTLLAILCTNFNLFIQPADVNECELETYPCSSNANCMDTDGSFNCTCSDGFEGGGFNCTGKLEILFPSKFSKCGNITSCISCFRCS